MRSQARQARASCGLRRLSTWGRAGRTPIAKACSRESGRPSMVGLRCFKPGSRSGPVYGLREYRSRKDEPRTSDGAVFVAAW